MMVGCGDSADLLGGLPDVLSASGAAWAWTKLYGGGPRGFTDDNLESRRVRDVVTSWATEAAAVQQRKRLQAEAQGRPPEAGDFAALFLVGHCWCAAEQLDLGQTHLSSQHAQLVEIQRRAESSLRASGHHLLRLPTFYLVHEHRRGLWAPGFSG